LASPTRFTDAGAVDIWDAQFRWRVGNELRDHTVDATWARVASTAAATEATQAAHWARRYVDAFSDWRLLPDERLLESAGTGVPIGWFGRPRALLNAGAFVLNQRTANARFDQERFATTAGLAVRLLDDALLSACQPGRTTPELRIGMLGVADAIAAMNLRYDSPQALEQVMAMAKALATGCLQGSVELARERGSHVGNPSSRRIATWEQRGMPQSLIDDARRYCVRHRRLTAIERQPNLALLANNASDALDPVIQHKAFRENTVPISAGSMEPISNGVLLAAHTALRSAVQPWIDVPINYPLISPIH
jgi:ribonucleoside-diphosphate reductase alpha chain